MSSDNNKWGRGWCSSIPKIKSLRVAVVLSVMDDLRICHTDLMQTKESAALWMAATAMRFGVQPDEVIEKMRILNTSASALKAAEDGKPPNSEFEALSKDQREEVMQLMQAAPTDEQIKEWAEGWLDA